MLTWKMMVLEPLWQAPGSCHLFWYWLGIRLVKAKEVVNGRVAWFLFFFETLMDEPRAFSGIAWGFCGQPPPSTKNLGHDSVRVKRRNK
jgi:hypothetical protein